MKLQKKFLDSVRIYVKGGRGGNGLPKYGGVGGKGGDVYVEAANKYNLKTLVSKFPSKRFIAGQGEDSRRFRVLGNPGNDVVVQCPVGISVVTDAKRNLGDLNQAGDRVLVARGGCGGGPENNYIGQKGQCLSVTLDLKLLADVGLIGFPNAGKSTLLKAVSKASPKIASYPFTTIQPNIGIMSYQDFRSISVADLPGLIEGAHLNYGMGHKFLKHCIRTKMLLFVIDIAGFQLKPEHPYRDAFETVMLLNKELELYDPDLCGKPAVLAVNKIDHDETFSAFDKLLSRLNSAKDHAASLPNEMRPECFVEFDAIVPISAKFKKNIPELKEKLRVLLDVHFAKSHQVPNETENDKSNENSSEESVLYV